VITRLHLENFRAIRKAEIELAPVTILTGGNSSGKSSLMYALLTLKNVVSNPNQPLDSFFSLSFTNLGGFKEAVHLKEEESRRTRIGIVSAASNYDVWLGKSQSSISMSMSQPASFRLHLDVTFPYALNQNTGIALEPEFGSAKITWNGLTATVSAEEAGHGELIQGIAAGANEVIEDIKGIDFVPLKRGFVRPVFSPVPLQPQLISEDEIATFLANDRDVEAAVSHYLETIVNRNFQVRPTLGTSSFYLQTIDRATGFVSDLVNDGFGTNQLVYLLTKALRRGQSTICIEEPEIHLHPAALVKLVEVLAEIAKEKKRNFVISTHSEHVVLALLNKLVSRDLEPKDVRVYHLRKERSETRIEQQQVTEKGQIEGGLKAFYETELQQIREFLAIGSAE